MDDICNCPGCDRIAVFRTYPVRKRRIVNPAFYCEAHSSSYWAAYDAKAITGDVQAQSLEDAVTYDIELLAMHDDHVTNLCWFFLRESGGKHRLGCQIGIFEAVSLLRELEGARNPRPLTHQAMAQIIAGLGGRVHSVIIDRFNSNGVYEASLRISQANEIIIVDVRPSDAVILAVVCDCPIGISNHTLWSLGVKR